MTESSQKDIYPYFPPLTAEQVECKVKNVKKNGAIALLYKTARVDADMLDEHVGRMNWGNDFEDIDGVLYATIRVRDPSDSTEWISKSDCGIESRADGEGNEKKGEASDAFKRAGFKWGIGRELYSAPFIFLNVETESNGSGYKLKNPLQSFDVQSIAYDENRRIKELTIIDAKTGTTVYSWKKKNSGKATLSKPVTTPVDTVITGDVQAQTDDTNPSDEGEITQEQIVAAVESYTKTLAQSQKRAFAAVIRKLNDGDVNFRNIPKPENRKALYAYIHDKMNEAVQQTA